MNTDKLTRRFPAGSPLRACSLLLLAALCSCGSVPKRAFRFHTIDNSETRLTCLVVVDDDWQAAAEREQVTRNGNPLTVEIEFPTPTAKVTVMQVNLDQDGKLGKAPTSRADFSDFEPEIRELDPRDPPDQLFILLPHR